MILVLCLPKTENDGRFTWHLFKYCHVLSSRTNSQLFILRITHRFLTASKYTPPVWCAVCWISVCCTHAPMWNRGCLWGLNVAGKTNNCSIEFTTPTRHPLTVLPGVWTVYVSIDIQCSCSSGEGRPVFHLHAAILAHRTNTETGVKWTICDLDVACIAYCILLLVSLSK